MGRLDWQLPVYCLMVFGCYALAKIGMGLISFKDCSEDAALLDQVRAAGCARDAPNLGVGLGRRSFFMAAHVPRKERSMERRERNAFAADVLVTSL